MHQNDEALSEIQQVQDLLGRLWKRVCEGCAQGDPITCSQVGAYGYVHISYGLCRARVYRALGSALDDLRDQHFNPFNPTGEQRMEDLCLLCHGTGEGEGATAKEGEAPPPLLRERTSP